MARTARAIRRASASKFLPCMILLLVVVATPTTPSRDGEVTLAAGLWTSGAVWIAQARSAAPTVRGAREQVKLSLTICAGLEPIDLVRTGTRCGRRLQRLSTRRC